MASTKGSTAETSTPSGAKSDNNDATPPISVGADNAASSASGDADALSRSNIYADRRRNARASASRASFSSGQLLERHYDQSLPCTD